MVARVNRVLVRMNKASRAQIEPIGCIKFDLKLVPEGRQSAGSPSCECFIRGCLLVVPRYLFEILKGVPRSVEIVGLALNPNHRSKFSIRALFSRTPSLNHDWVCVSMHGNPAFTPRGPGQLAFPNQSAEPRKSATPLAPRVRQLRAC